MAQPKRRRELKCTLWKAKLKIGVRAEEFLFREEPDFSKASATAQELIEGSTAAEIAGAQIVAVERVGHLWN